jgi:hypothetical protein
MTYINIWHLKQQLTGLMEHSVCICAWRGNICPKWSNLTSIEQVALQGHLVKNQLQQRNYRLV